MLLLLLFITIMMIIVIIIILDLGVSQNETVIYTGWWLAYPSEKYDFVNGKDDVPYMKWKITHHWNHQPEYIYIL